MNIVTTTSVFPFDYPCDKALLRLAKVGFKYLDLAMDYCASVKDGPFASDGWESWAEGLRELAEKSGVQYTHSHAWGDASSRHMLTLRCFDVCRVMKIPYCVVHPVWRDESKRVFEDTEEFVKINAESIKPLLEAAERNGVILLSENLLWGASIQLTAVAALVKEVNSPYFGWCYDTGHANAYSVSPTDLLSCDAEPLSLHVQDNHGNGKDEHLLPGDGTMDWKLFMNSLKKCGYQGDLVLEAHHQSIDAPDEKRDEILSELLCRAEKMREYYLGLQ